MQLESYAMEKLKVPPLFCPGGSDFRLWQMEEMCPTLIHLDYEASFYNK